MRNKIPSLCYYVHIFLGRNTSPTRRVLAYEHLLERVWREQGDGNGPMHTMVSKLRRKLSDDPTDPTYIFTEPRVGFRMPRGEGR